MHGIRVSTCVQGAGIHQQFGQWTCNPFKNWWPVCKGQITEFYYILLDYFRLLILLVAIIVYSVWPYFVKAKWDTLLKTVSA